jgi:nicotinate-nucleotide--dimethylbenzimidazole phosphoribosyltransferase
VINACPRAETGWETPAEPWDCETWGATTTAGAAPPVGVGAASGGGVTGPSDTLPVPPDCAGGVTTGAGASPVAPPVGAAGAPVAPPAGAALAVLDTDGGGAAADCELAALFGFATTSGTAAPVGAEPEPDEIGAAPVGAEPDCAGAETTEPVCAALAGAAPEGAWTDCAEPAGADCAEPAGAEPVAAEPAGAEAADPVAAEPASAAPDGAEVDTDATDESVAGGPSFAFAGSTSGWTAAAWEDVAWLLGEACD